MAYNIRYSDYPTSAGPPDPIRWVGPPGPPGPVGPVGPPGTEAIVYTADTPPAGDPGTLWWDSAGTGLYIRYNDGNSTQWVVAQNQNALNDAPDDGSVYARQSSNWVNLATAPGMPFLLLSGGTVAGPLTIQSNVPGTASGYWGLEADATNAGPSTGTGHKFGYLSRASGGGGYDVGLSEFAVYTAAGTRQMGMWFVAISPNDSINTFATQLGEWNIVNRGPDAGWMADPSGRGHVGGGPLNSTGGLVLVPESSAFGAEGGGEGKNATFAFCVSSSNAANSTGHLVKFYNGYIVSSGAIVGQTGRAIYLTGDLSGDTTQYPYGPLQLDGTWLHGIDHTVATYTDNHAETLKTGQSIAWINGPTAAPTATATIAGSGSGANASLTLTAAGSGVISLTGNVARTVFTGGISMGDLTGAGNSDISNGISFYGGQIGFGLTAARLNYVVGGGNAHMFVVNNVDVANINGNGITAIAAMQVGGTSGPTWTTGSAAPASTQPIGSLYSRVGGAVGATLYISRGGGSWAAVAGV